MLQINNFLSLNYGSVFGYFIIKSTLNSVKFKIDIILGLNDVLFDRVIVVSAVLKESQSVGQRTITKRH